MKKFVLVSVLVATLIVALVAAGSVFAQAPTPAAPQTPGTGYGRGMMGAGMRGAGMGTAAGEGILHDTMISVFAQKLGLSVDELNARLSNGETMAQIAAEKGLTAEQFTALMTDARTQAIDQAVKDGTLTQAQADWMKTRGSAMFGNSGMMGAGQRGAGRGMRGSGAGFGTGNPAACPYFTQTNP